MEDSLIVAQVGAVVGAVIAALGYCANLAVQEFQERRSRRDARKSSLIELQSLLLALYTAFRTQRRLLRSLAQEIKESNRGIGDVGYDKALALGFPKLTDEQKLRHGLIRSYTMRALRPLNMSILEWLSKDRYFKSQGSELGLKLRQLEAHLILWSAKYEFWIPDRPERAIVFLADEEQQGTGFPKGIEALVCQETGTPFKQKEDVPENLKRDGQEEKNQKEEMRER